MLVAALTRDVRSSSWIMDWMCCRCSISRGDRLSASQMQRRLAGYLGAETKSDTAMTAAFVRHRAHGVTFRVIAGPAAWTPGYAGSGNYDDAHIFILAASFCGNSKNPNPATILTLELLTICSKSDTYS